MTVLSCAAALCAACAGAVCAQDPDASKDKYQLLVEQLRSSATYAAAEKALIASGPDAVPALVEGAVQLPNLKNRMTGRIARIGPGAVPKLIALLGDPAMRDTAGGILFLVASPASFEQVPALLACARLPDTRHSCGMSLAKVMSAKAQAQVPALAKALEDPDKDLRMYAAAALGQGPAAKDAVQALAGALGDPEAAVRMAAAAALGKMKGAARDSLPALEKLAADPNGDVAAAAAQAVKAIQGPKPKGPKSAGGAKKAPRKGR